MLYVRAGNLDRKYDEDPEEVKKERDRLISEFSELGMKKENK